jgi:heme a synthase
VVAAAAAFRVAGLRRWLLWSAVALPFTVLAQGVLGGITVIFELHPLIVMGHFLLSLAALGLAVVVAQGARGLSRSARQEPPLGAAWPALALVPATLALVVSGTLVTAAGPHSGGEDIPRVGNLIDAVHVHMGATAVFGITFLSVLALLLVERSRARAELGLACVALLLLLGQVAVGEVQWRGGLPWGLVLVHVTLATGVWVAVVALAARVVLRRRARLPA